MRFSDYVAMPRRRWYGPALCSMPALLLTAALVVYSLASMVYSSFDGLEKLNQVFLFPLPLLDSAGYPNLATLTRDRRKTSRNLSVAMRLA